MTFFFILELFKEAWECGYNTNNIEKKTVKITSWFSILICQHYALIDDLILGTQKVTVPYTSTTFPTQGYPRRWEGAEVHKLFTVCIKQVRFPYTELAASGI